MNLDEAKSLFNRAIRKFPYFECKQLCQEACGVVCWTEAEEMVIADWLEAQGRKGRVGDLKTCVCPYLEAGACSIYEVRPIICRLFGLVKDDDRMICPHGCKPRMKERQVQRIMKPLLNRTDALYGPFDLGE